MIMARGREVGTENGDGTGMEIGIWDVGCEKREQAYGIELGREGGGGQQWVWE